jgi:drug/metabolite transporter (DMT)-like permease
VHTAATKSHSTRTSLLALVVGAIAIGFAPIFVRLSELGPSATAFWRVTLAAPVLLVWALLTPSPAHREHGWRILVLAGLFFAGDLAFWHWSIRLTSVANATLEANLASIFVTLILWLVYRRRPSRAFLLALIVALFGTALLIGRNVRISAPTLKGDAMGVITAIFYSSYLLAVKAARDRGFGTAGIMTVSGVITALALWPVAVLSGENLWPQTMNGWSILLALALISHIGGQGLIAYALAGLPAAFASVGLLVQPATAAVAAWLLLGETLSIGQFAGGAILLLGIYLARRDSA